MDENRTADPIRLFADWLAEAGKSEPNDPNAMALATTTPTASPRSAWSC